MQPTPSLPSSSSGSGSKSREEANICMSDSFRTDEPLLPSSSAAAQAVLKEVNENISLPTGSATAQELDIQLANILATPKEEVTLHRDICKVVIEILGSDLIYFKARNQRTQLREVVGTLRNTSLVNRFFRYLSQSELFKQVRFNECFDEAGFEKFYTILQPHIGRNIQVLRLSANMMCIMINGRHVLNYDTQVDAQDPMADDTGAGADAYDSASDHGSFGSDDSGFADGEDIPALETVQRMTVNMNAVARSRILPLIQICLQNLRKLEVQGRLTDSDRDNNSLMQHDFSPDGRNLAESIFLAAILEALCNIRFPSLRGLAFTLNSFPQPFWGLDQSQPQGGDDQSSGSSSTAILSVLQQNLTNILSLFLSVRNNVASVGGFVALTAPSANDLSLHMGAGQDGDARWLGMNPQSFRPAEATGIEGVRNLTLNSLLVHGSLSTMLLRLTRLRILAMLDIQLIRTEDKWSLVFDACAQLKRNRSLAILEVRWGGYKHEGVDAPPPFGTCALWTYERTLGMDGANSYGRALCTPLHRDEDAFESVMEAFHGPRRGRGNDDYDSDEEDENPGAETQWVVCLHQAF